MMVVAVNESASGLGRAMGDVASHVASGVEEDDVEGKVS